MTSTLWPVSFEVFPLKKQTARGVFKTAKSALSTETELELEAAKVQKASTSRLPNKQGGEKQHHPLVAITIF